MLIRNHQLTPSQLIDLELLCAECKAEDGNIIATYTCMLSKDRPRLCNTLYYSKKKLVGFLSTFFFYENACEVSVMVKPDYRKRGLARHMINDILPLIRSEKIDNLIFSTPHETNKKWLLAKGFRYQRCEYQMQRQDAHAPLIPESSLTIRAATSDDLAILCALDKACFAVHQPDTLLHFHNLLYDPNYRIFVSELDGVVIGKAHLDMQRDNTRLTDIAVLPDFQGRGFGSKMIAYCINYSLAENQSKITLNVETNNQQALKIYTGLGFVIENAYDFWTIPIQVLRFAKH